MYGHLIYNHAHLQDAFIQQELSRYLYKSALGPTYVVHSWNGARSVCRAYLEDAIVSLPNRGHFQGAVDLINAGLKHMHDHKAGAIRYVIVTAADTWFLDPQYLSHLLSEMEQERKVLAACSWGYDPFPHEIDGLSMDAFVVDLSWAMASRVFPLDYASFLRRFADTYLLEWRQPVPEYAFAYRVNRHYWSRYPDSRAKAERDKALRRMVEREPVRRRELSRRQWFPRPAILSTNEPALKRRTLRRLGLHIGPVLRSVIGGSAIRR